MSVLVLMTTLFCHVYQIVKTSFNMPGAADQPVICLHAHVNIELLHAALILLAAKGLLLYAIATFVCLQATMSRLTTAPTFAPFAACYSCSIRPVFRLLQEGVNLEAALQKRLQQLEEELRLSAQEAESKQAVVTDLQDELAAAHTSNESLAAKLQVSAVSH